MNNLLGVLEWIRKAEEILGNDARLEIISHNYELELRVRWPHSAYSSSILTEEFILQVDSLSNVEENVLRNMRHTYEKRKQSE